MKFYALMQDQNDMKDFLNIILTLSKLTKTCIMDIYPNKINFIASEDSDVANTTLQVWAETLAETNFAEYVMKGLNEKNQRIMLSFNSINMARAVAVLRSGAKYCKLKLTKNETPCLSIEMQVFSNVWQLGRQFVHNIPVTVVPKGDWDVFSLPQVPASDCVFTLSSNHSIRCHIDTLRNISPWITFYATSDGDLNITAETELSTVSTRYRNLEISHMDTDAQARNNQQKSTCTVDSKKLATFFSALQVPSPQWSCSIFDNVLIHFRISLGCGMKLHSTISRALT